MTRYDDVKILGIGMFLIGAVLVVEALLIILLILNISSGLTQVTFLAGAGYVIFKLAAGLVSVYIGLKPLSYGKKTRRARRNTARKP